MNRLLYICIGSILFIFTFIACDKKRESPVLISNLKSFSPSGNKIKLSELLTDSCRLIPLETTDDSLLGKIYKIKKHNNTYYLLSDDRWILRFDENGKFISSLNCLGSGPEEYTYIGDFDVYTVDGRDEIWLCDYDHIKIYDAEHLTYLQSIHYPFVINKFKRIDVSHILLLTGQNKQMLTLSNEEGKVISVFLEKEIAYIVWRPVQFRQYSSQLIFQLGMANSYVSFDLEKKNFHRGILCNCQELLSDKELLDLFIQYGQDYIWHIGQRKPYIRGIQKLKEKTIVNIRSENDEYIVSVPATAAEAYTVGSFSVTSNIENDLFGLKDMSFLKTINIGESSSSLLLYIEADMLQDIPIKDKNGIIHDIQPEDNPCLVEFY